MIPFPSTCDPSPEQVSERICLRYPGVILLNSQRAAFHCWQVFPYLWVCRWKVSNINQRLLLKFFKFSSVYFFFSLLFIFAICLIFYSFRHYISLYETGDNVQFSWCLRTRQDAESGVLFSNSFWPAGMCWELLLSQ